MSTGLHVLVLSVTIIFSIFTPAALGQNNRKPTKDFYLSVYEGQETSFNNTEYPSNYRQLMAIRWTVIAPRNYRILMTCDELIIPKSDNCNQERLEVSLTGDRTFSNAQRICDKNGPYSLVSTTNTLAIGLFTWNNIIGGHFRCSLTAFRDLLPPSSTSKPSTCDCGWKKPGGLSIVNGVEAEVNEFPHMCGVYDLIGLEVRGGASIISDTYALTAAHVINDRKADELELRIGMHNKKNFPDTPYSKTFIISELLVHPQFNSRNNDYDIGIIKTIKRLTSNIPNVGPICLPFLHSTESFAEKPVTVAGWGKLSDGGPTSDTLQKVQLDVVSVETCLRDLKPVTSFAVTANTLCTYTKGKDSCRGDSGGPVMWFDRSINRNYLVGVVSYGKFCASSAPGANTRVTSYLPWIIESTPDASYCVK